MKTKILSLSLIAALAIVALPKEIKASDCPTPNFAKIFDEVKATKRISEALQVRQNHLEEMCDLKDFVRLTELETSDGTIFPAYQRRLIEFTIENVGVFAKNTVFSANYALITRRLLPRVTDVQQSIALREKLVPTLENCGDLNSIVYPWESGQGGELQRALQRFTAKYSEFVCK